MRLPKYLEIYINYEPKVVSAKDYINAKTKDLQEFGYSNLTEEEVQCQLLKVLNNETDLSVIGEFIKPDIVSD